MTETRTIPPDILRRVGEACYGERWQSALAAAWNVNDRTVRSWASGRMEFPPARIADLRETLQRRRRDIDQAEQLLAALSEPAG